MRGAFEHVVLDGVVIQPPKVTRTAATVETQHYPTYFYCRCQDHVLRPCGICEKARRIRLIGGLPGAAVKALEQHPYMMQSNPPNPVPDLAMGNSFALIDSVERSDLQTLVACFMCNSPFYVEMIATPPEPT